jgi:hypothetical protein
MKRALPALLVCITSIACIAACSGPLTSGGGGGTGNGSIVVTMTSKPLAPPPSTSILSASFTVTGISLTPATGSAVNLTLPGTTVTLDATRLQSDSAFLGNALSNVPAGTYSSLTLAITNPSVTYCTQPNPGLAGCVSGSVATVTGGIVAPVITTPITVTENQTTGLRVQLDLTPALTINATTQAVTAINLGAASVFSVSTLPPSASSLASGQLDFVEDFTGIVTAVTGTSSFTITTAKHGAITISNNSAAFFSPNCATSTFAGCVALNQLASVDAALKSDGTFTLLEYDPLETTASDWIEGVVTLTPTSPTQFEIVANDIFLASTGSLIGSNLSIGNRVGITLQSGATFGVDTKGLNVPVDAITFENASDTSVLRPGQIVAVHLATFTPAPNGTTPASATVDFVGLRFSRVTGHVQSSAPPNVFFIQDLPPFFGTTIQQEVQLNQAIAPQTAPTNYDGVTDASGIAAGQVISIRALYFGSGSAVPFTAAKVRTH